MSSLFVSMTGASELVKKQAAHTNNLANVSTTAFKFDMPETHSMPVYQEDTLPTRVYTGTKRMGADFSSGTFISTGNELDVAIVGDGFLAVQGSDGQEAYTRRGDLKVSSQGFLINGSEHLVLGNGGPIAVPPADMISIGQDGVVSFVPQGASSGTYIVLDKIKLVKAPLEGLQKNTEGLFQLVAGSAGVEEDPALHLETGVVEGSNVNPITELLGLINTARQYELNVQMMKKHEENDEASARIMQMK